LYLNSRPEIRDDMHCRAVTETRLKKHWRHCIQVRYTSILSKKAGHMDHTISEVTEVELNPENMKEEDGFCLSKSWKPLMCSLIYHRKPPKEDSVDRFSTLPCRSTHPALIGAPTVASQEPMIPTPFLPALASLRNFCFS
jgi:hypothetical protein